MRKYGKYEKMPDGTRAKQPAPKMLLLQTYFTSLLCVVLCVAMLLGTTYAWFTSSVTNTANEIYIGTLDVGLYKMKNGSEVSLSSSDSAEKLFDGNIRWEPGYTAMETIKIKNEGDLSFRYALTFTDGTINSSNDAALLREVAENFLVYVHVGDYAPGEEAPKSFQEIQKIAEDDTVDEMEKAWRVVRMGKDPATLADILEKGFPVLSGNMEEENETDTYIIALHMTGDEDIADATKQEALNALMGKKIGLNVKLTAYQRTHEQDAFNKDYDLQAHVTNLGALDVHASTWLNAPTCEMTLDSAYQFQPVETFEEWNESTFRDYIADFTIWSNSDIPENSVAVAGYYDLWCSLNEDRWIYLQSSDVIKADTEIELVEALTGSPMVHYKDLCQYANDGIGFLCGIKNLSSANVGKVIIVELRLYAPAEDGSKSDNYIVAGRYEYTLEEPNGTIVEIN